MEVGNRERVNDLREGMAVACRREWEADAKDAALGSEAMDLPVPYRGGDEQPWGGLGGNCATCSRTEVRQALKQAQARDVSLAEIIDQKERDLDLGSKRARDGEGAGMSYQKWRREITGWGPSPGYWRSGCS